MPRHLFKRYTPDHHRIRNHRHLKVFGALLHDPNLWHLNRRSVSGAFAIGLFWAVIPIPLQMLAAAASAIVVRVNLPISVALVWLTNPLTMPPVFYCCYLVGTWILGERPHVEQFKLSLDWIRDSIGQIWQPLLLGSVLVGLLLAALGFLGIRTFWRWHVIHKYRKRHPEKDQSLPSRS
jgi:uncharacterized protein (DUF2062 family)